MFLGNNRGLLSGWGLYLCCWDIFLGYYNNVEDDLSSVLKMYITKDHLNSLFGKDGFQKAINSRYEIHVG